MNILETYTSDIKKLCESHKVKSLYAFGSVLTERFNGESDIDLIVDFSNIEVEDYAFMDNDIKDWLYDILNAIMEIESFFTDRTKEFANYQVDLRTKRAVERNIEIIGEAMNRILKEDESITISNSRKLVDVWNRIIHGYDSVSDDVIWGIVIKLNIFLLYRLKSKNY